MLTPTGERRRPGCAPRGTALAITMSALCACTTHSLEAPALKTDETNTTTFRESVNRKIDILFMVDNSSSMKPSQANLLANFPVFMDVLTGLPGGLPSVHIAVVSSDLGAGAGLSGSCAGNGDAGLFQATARGSCDTTLMNGAHFISNVDGVANYTAPIEQVFSCMAALGDGGCGFEQPLLSAAAALGLVPPGIPADNAGFLRDDAYLAIILITNEDDCSGPKGASSDLFTERDGNLASQFGPPQGYRCNEFGHLCGSPLAPPLRLAPGGDVKAKVTLDGCVPAENQGKLIPVADLAVAFKQLKPDPENQILVAAITGPTTPYTVGWIPPTNPDTGPWPAIEHSCLAHDGSYADPAIRISEWVKQFGRNGVLQSICDDSFRPAMTRIAAEIGRIIGPKCVTAKFADKDGDPANGVQYDCAATSHVAEGNGQPRDVKLPACADSNGALPCWRLADDAACTAPPGAPPGTTSKRLLIDSDRATTTEINADVSCAVCPEGSPDPRCR
jgi:hypothetical protein